MGSKKTIASLHDLCVCITAIVHKSNKFQRDGQQRSSHLWLILLLVTVVVILALSFGYFVYRLKLSVCRALKKNENSLPFLQFQYFVFVPFVCIATKVFFFSFSFVRSFHSAICFGWVRIYCCVFCRFICDRKWQKLSTFRCCAIHYERGINKMFQFSFIFYWTNDKIIPAAYTLDCFCHWCIHTHTPFVATMFCCSLSVSNTILVGTFGKIVCNLTCSCLVCNGICHECCVSSEGTSMDNF